MSNFRHCLLLSLLCVPMLAYCMFPQRARAQEQNVNAIIEELQLANRAHAGMQYMTMEDYQKLQVYSGKADTALLVLIESYFRDSVTADATRETELMRKESATLPVQLGRLAYFHPLDLYKDRIELPDYYVSGPLGQYGLLDYSFRIMSSEGEQYEIAFLHRGSVFPGIEGTLWVDKLSKRLVRAEFSTNDAVNLELLKDLRWSEEYTSIKGMNVLTHSELRLVAKTQLWLLPKYQISITNDLRDFEWLTKEGKTRTVTGNMAGAFDSIVFEERRPRRLTSEEYRAYERAGALTSNSASAWTTSSAISGVLFDPDILQYNRVEGLRVQLRERISEIGTWPLAVDALAAYGFGDKRWKYDVTASQGLFWHDVQSVTTSMTPTGAFHTYVRTLPVPWLSVGARLHDDRQLRGTARSIAMNTISALGYKSDYPDYFWSHGLTGFLVYRPYSLVDIELALKNEQQSTIDSVVATFSILSPHKAFRLNPPIENGYLRELRGTLNWNMLPEGFGQGRQFYSRIEIAHASKSWSSDFEYSVAALHVAASFPDQQWGLSTIYFDGGATFSGALPNQQLFLFETPRGFSNRTRSFLTIKDREFQGDRIAMLFLEQNMFDLPTRALGIHFLDPLDLHWFAFANVGHSGLSDSTRAKLRTPVETTGNVPYTEAGIGVGNILNILRLDGAWRLTHHEAIGAGFAFIATLGLTI